MFIARPVKSERNIVLQYYQNESGSSDRPSAIEWHADFDLP